jgi:hypothetical protein
LVPKKRAVLRSANQVRKDVGAPSLPAGQPGAEGGRLEEGARLRRRVSELASFIGGASRRRTTTSGEAALVRMSAGTMVRLPVNRLPAGGPAGAEGATAQDEGPAGAAYRGGRPVGGPWDLLRS